MENYVLQSLMNQFEVTPRYWPQASPPDEADLLIQRENDAIPTEVKAERNLQGRSLKKNKGLNGDQSDFAFVFRWRT